MLYNTRHLTELYSISASTVKKYCGIFGQFLSDDARPEKGSHRLFDTNDLKVFSFIVQQLKNGERHDNVIMALANGERGEIPSGHGEYTITMESKEQIVLLQTRIMQLEGRVLELEGERDRRVGAEANIVLLKEQLEDAHEKIVQLRMKFGGED